MSRVLLNPRTGLGACVPAVYRFQIYHPDACTRMHIPNSYVEKTLSFVISRETQRGQCYGTAQVECR